MARYSEAQNKAVQKYVKNNYDDIKLRVPKGEKEVFQKLAKDNGDSLNGYIYKLLTTELKKQKRAERIKIDVLTGIPEDYEGAAVYSLIDDCGRKYIGSTTNLKKRLKSHATHMRTVLADGKDGFVCKKMERAILEGHVFHVEVLEKFPDGITKEELQDKEYYYLEKEGGCAHTYNTKPIKRVIKNDKL